MSKRTRPRKSLNSVSPSTPKHIPKRHEDDNIFATPKSHYIDDDDSDSSPYSLSFSQRSMRTGVEVTWGERKKSTPFKSKTYVESDTESPPTNNKFYVEPLTESKTPKGLFKFLIGLEKLGTRSQIENDFQAISDSTRSTFNDDGNVTVNRTNSNSSSTNDSNFYTASEQPMEDTKSKLSNSPNYKQLLNDSEDMDLVMYSQQIEQEAFKRTDSVIQPIASKGFSDAFSDDNDDSLLANLDDPLLLDNKLPQKTLFARHKSIAIHPNTSIKYGNNASNQQSNYSLKVGSDVQPTKKSEPLTPIKRPSTTTSKPLLVRHKSMPSPILIAESTKKCTAEEIEMKRQQAIAKLKQRKNNNSCATNRFRY